MSVTSEKTKWQIAGKELMRGNFGLAIKAATSQVMDPMAYRGGMFFFGEGEPVKFFEYDTLEAAAKAYKACPEFQSIVNRRATAHTSGKRWVMNTRGKEAKSDFAEKSKKLLDRPNPFQSGKQWDAQLKIYIDIFGWCLILPIYSSDAAAKYGFSEATALFLIPPYMLTWKETGKWRYNSELKDVISEIKLTIGGSITDLPLDRIAIIKDNTPRLMEGYQGGMGSMLVFPDSKVRAQAAPINNIIGAYESRGELISFAGSQGIVSPNPGTGQFVAMDMTDPEEKELQRKFKQQYGIKRKQYRYIISPKPILWQQMGRPTKDLMLFEEVDADVKAICNAWPYPWKLLADSGSSLNGTEVDSLTRNWYQDSIIPESQSIDQQLSEAFKCTENNVKFDTDFSNVPALQANKKEAAEARYVLNQAKKIEFDNGLITLNDWLVSLGEDPIGELGDVRATDPSNSIVPLAATIGVGGVQGLIEVLTAQGIDSNAKQSVLEIVFGLAPADAARMTTSETPPAATEEPATTTT